MRASALVRLYEELRDSGYAVRVRPSFVTLATESPARIGAPFWMKNWGPDSMQFDTHMYGRTASSSRRLNQLHADSYSFGEGSFGEGSFGEGSFGERVHVRYVCTTLINSSAAKTRSSSVAAGLATCWRTWCSITAPMNPSMAPRQATACCSKEVQEASSSRAACMAASCPRIRLNRCASLRFSVSAYFMMALTLYPYGYMRQAPAMPSTDGTLQPFGRIT